MRCVHLKLADSNLVDIPAPGGVDVIRQDKVVLLVHIGGVPGVGPYRVGASAYAPGPGAPFVAWWVYREKAESVHLSVPLVQESLLLAAGGVGYLEKVESVLLSLPLV